MPTTLGKVSLLFDDGRSGWSETYWKNAADLTALLVLAKGMAQARAQLLGFGASILEARVSDVGAATPALKRISQVAILSGPQSTSLVLNNSGFKVDIASTSLLVRFTGTSGRRYMRHLSGIPDSLTQQDVQNGFSTTDPFWVGVWNNFVASAGLGLYGFRYNSGTPTSPIWNIENSTAVVAERVQRKNRGRRFFQPVGRRT